ncbi:MAG: hypothetical protein NVSMB9_17370 [Isosphaeraceae bacterium]
MMSGGVRRGGIPGPESRTGLVRPAMTEAEFERRQQPSTPVAATGGAYEATESFPVPAGEPETSSRSAATGANGTRGRATRPKAAKPRRVQRMFALEEDLDKKLWLYAIHVGKDRSEVVNDLLRPLVASMVLYDSRDRRAGRVADPVVDRTLEGDGEAAA